MIRQSIIQMPGNKPCLPRQGDLNTHEDEHLHAAGHENLPGAECAGEDEHLPRAPTGRALAREAVGAPRRRVRARADRGAGTVRG